MCKINWDTLSNIAQGLGAIVSAVLAWIVFQQQKSIKSLTDVVIKLEEQTVQLKDQTTQLKSQSEILIKRYELEKTLSLESRIPVFEKNGPHQIIEHIGRYTLHLKNIGRKAFYLEIINNSGIYRVDKGDFEEVDNNGILPLSIFFDDPKMIKTGFQFDIKCSNNFGNESIQQIKTAFNSLNYTISNPADSF